MDLSWQLLNQLAGQYGDSFYLLDLDAFRRNYQEFLSAFRSIYPKSSIAYSYKTNYIPRLCHCANQMGGYSEVVSLMEYELAMHIGVSPGRIIFNGPYKGRDGIEIALLAGSTVNLDSNYELELVKDIAGRWPEHKFSIGLRCNFDIKTGGISRFGFDIQGKEFENAIKIINSLKNCSLEGLHCHFSTSERSVESYAFRARKMLEACSAWFGQKYPRFIDLGGGYFGKMDNDLRKQYPVHVPDYREYAEAIASQFAQLYKNKEGPELILEPGMALTADVIKFAAKVVDIKTVQSKKFALVSGSIHNIKPSLHNKTLPIEVIRKNGDKSSQRTGQSVDIVGYTCMEHDYLYKGFKGIIEPEDFVVFKYVGAYTIVLKPPFIQPCPAVIASDAASGKLEIVKNPEEFKDVFKTYIF